MADVTSRVTAIVAMVDKISTPMRAVERRLDGLRSMGQRIGQGALEWSNRSVRGFELVGRGLGNIFRGAGQAVGALARVGVVLAGILAGGALAGGLFSISRALENFVETGSRLNTVSERLGVTVKTLQDFEHWGAKSNVSAEAMDSSLGRLNRTLSQVAVGKNKEATKLMGFIGIAARDSQGHIRDAASVLPQLADVFSRIHNPAQKARLAVALFGKSGQELIPVLSQGRAGLAAARAELDRIGRVTQRETQQAEELENAQRILRLQLERLQLTLASKLAPVLMPLITRLSRWIEVNRDWLGLQMDYWIHLIATRIGELWTKLRQVDWTAWGRRIDSVITALGRLSDAVGGPVNLLAIFVGLLAAMSFAPLVLGLAQLVSGLAMVGAALLGLGAPVTLALLALGAIGLVAYKIYQNWDDISPRLRARWTQISDWARDIGRTVDRLWRDTWNAIGNYIQTKWSALTSWLRAKWQAIVTTAQAIWQSLPAPIRDALTAVYDVVVWLATQLQPVFRRIERGAARLRVVWDTIRAAWSSALSGLETLVSGTFDRILGKIEAVVANPIFKVLAGIMQFPLGGVGMGMVGPDLATALGQIGAALLPPPGAAGGLLPGGLLAAAPAGAAAVGGPVAAAAGMYGPFAGGYAFPPEGQVNVNVDFANVPPGTTTKASSSGNGVKATTSRTGHSMPQLQPGNK